MKDQAIVAKERHPRRNFFQSDTLYLCVRGIYPNIIAASHKEEQLPSACSLTKKRSGGADIYAILHHLLKTEGKE